MSDLIFDPTHSPRTLLATMLSMIPKHSPKTNDFVGSCYWAVNDSLPSDIRGLGWAVAIHNDYRLNGENHTFWLFTKGESAVKGEGKTDAEALNQVRARLRDLGHDI